MHEAERRRPGRARRPIAPCPVLMPHEVMKHRGFDSKRSRHQVVQSNHPDENRHHRELHQHSGDTNRVECDPTFCRTSDQFSPARSRTAIDSVRDGRHLPGKA